MEDVTVASTHFGEEADVLRYDSPADYDEILRDVKALMNTLGVSRIVIEMNEILPEE